MGNMIYYRFINTANLLQECFFVWDKPLLTEHERRGKQRIRKLVLEMAARFKEEDEK